MRYLNSIIWAIGGILVAILVSITSLAVFMRYAMNQPFKWTEEVSAILMIWIVMLGAISCEWQKRHLTIDLLVATFSRGTQKVLAVAVAVVSIAVLLYISWTAWELAQAAALKRTQILRVSWFWIDLAVVVGTALTALVTLWHLLGWAPEDDTTEIHH